MKKVAIFVVCAIALCACGGGRRVVPVRHLLRRRGERVQRGASPRRAGGQARFRARGGRRVRDGCGPNPLQRHEHHRPRQLPGT